MSERAQPRGAEARLVRTLLLATLAAPLAVGHVQAQEAGAASTSSAEGLRDRVLATLGDDHEGRAVLVRIRLSAPDDAEHPEHIARELLDPTLRALEADERFALAHAGRFSGEDVEAARTAHRLGYDTLVDLAATIDPRRLRVTGVLWATAEPPTELGGLELSAPVEMATRAHLGFPERRVDAAIRARAGRLPGRDYLGLAIVDLDGDGRAEIVLARDDGVHVVHANPGRVGLRIDNWGQAPWPTSVPRHPAPPRRPFATEWIGHGGVLFFVANRVAPFFVTADGRGVHAQATLGPCEPEWFPYRGSCARRIPGRDFFDDEVAFPGEVGRRESVGAHHYSRVVHALPSRDGSTTRYEALVTTRGRLVVRAQATSGDPDAEPPEAHSSGAPGYGTALAIGDLDLDGEAELLTSGAVVDSRNDTLTVLRARASGGLRVAWQSEPVTGAVWVAAAGDVDGDGLDELLAIEEPPGRRGRARLWVVQ